MPTLTFIATANAVSYAGAVPHFVDSEAVSLGVDAAKLDAHLREVAQVVDGVCVNRRSGAPMRALVVMHVFGHPCDLDALAEVAARWHLVLVEDAAESLGSTYHGRHTGNVGLRVGAQLQRQQDRHDRRRRRDPDERRRAGAARQAPDDDGAHAAPLELPARRGRLQLPPAQPQRGARLRAARAAARRWSNASARWPRATRDAFAEVDGVRFLREPPATASNYWLNAIVLDAAHADERDALLAALNDAGYMSRPRLDADAPPADVPRAARAWT